VFICIPACRSDLVGIARIKPLVLKLGSLKICPVRRQKGCFSPYLVRPDVNFGDNILIYRIHSGIPAGQVNKNVITTKRKIITFALLPAF
jgi:hypothetical protein